MHSTYPVLTVSTGLALCPCRGFCLRCHAIKNAIALVRGLQEPFNLNKVDDHGNTLLMVAAQNGNLKMSKLFIYKGSNPNHQVRRLSVCICLGVCARGYLDGWGEGLPPVPQATNGGE